MLTKVDDILNLIDRASRHATQKNLDLVLQNAPQIEEVMEMLADAPSRDLYGRVIASNILRTFLREDLPSALSGIMSNRQWNAYAQAARNIHPEMVSPPNDNWEMGLNKACTFVLGQYQYKDKVRVEQGDVFLDIGACLGDASIWACENGATQSWAFEIDRNNLECLARNAAAAGFQDSIRIAPCAVADKIGEIWFNPCQSNIGAGQISSQAPDARKEEGYPVSCVTVDSFCAQNSITPAFIKMDIEGAEPRAIIGARATFARFRPKFAICIYHSLEQHWQIPLLLRQLCPDYNFYLKKTHPVWETVILGAPK